MLFLFRRRQRKKRNKTGQQGVVLIMALFIMAMAATMAYVMMTRLARDIHRTNLILNATQGDFYAQGAVAWAEAQLRENWEKQKPHQLIDQLPMQMPPQTVDNYRITCTINDMQSKFNINNIAASPEAQSDFIRLLRLVQPSLSETQATTMSEAVRFWLLPGSQSQDDDAYLKLSPPYRAAHRAMANINELRLVKGMSLDLLQGIKNVATALPAGTPVNVQTASALVLASLVPKLSLQTARLIEQVRLKKPFTAVQDFLDLEFVKNNNLKADGLTVISQYFLVETTTAIDEQRIILYTLLMRSVGADKKVSINIVWQSKNID